MARVIHTYNSQVFLKIYNAAHIVCAAICIVCAIIMIFAGNKTLFVPPIFAAGNIYFTIRFCAVLDGYDRAKKRAPALALLAVCAVLLLFLTITSAICFW